ncbi:uncharacterized protein LOC121373755 [Gigantopelta aegis]|uniref:uncharacterized protein LOC121373755 n=1 Tax=Gigantopelta aegis TaxID=1735272 RepID=UPI001B88C3B3|nr:uncharacterized protein LOC121373755 [Gigantopelta aegis]
METNEANSTNNSDNCREDRDKETDKTTQSAKNKGKNKPVKSDSCGKQVNEGGSTPKTSKRKRSRIDSEVAEIELLVAMKNSIEASKQKEPDDDITVYLKNLGCKLRKITDSRVLLMVQNEIEQIIFRANMGKWDNHVQAQVSQVQPSQTQSYGMYTTPSTSTTQVNGFRQNWYNYENGTINSPPSDGNQTFTSMLEM